MRTVPGVENNELAILSRVQEPENPPIEGGLIQSVVLVDRLVRPTVSEFHAPSLPGHLLHFVVEGEVEQWSPSQTAELRHERAEMRHELRQEAAELRSTSSVLLIS